MKQTTFYRESSLKVFFIIFFYDYVVKCVLLFLLFKLINTNIESCGKTSVSEVVSTNICNEPKISALSMALMYEALALILALNT